MFCVIRCDRATLSDASEFVIHETGDRATIDFGHITQYRQYERMIGVKNESTASWNNVFIKKDCGCVSAEVLGDAKEVPPGLTLGMRVRFRPDGVHGQFLKRLSVFGSDKSECFSVIVTGNVELSTKPVISSPFEYLETGETSYSLVRETHIPSNYVGIQGLVTSVQNGKAAIGIRRTKSGPDGSGQYDTYEYTISGTLEVLFLQDTIHLQITGRNKSPNGVPLHLKTVARVHRRPNWDVFPAQLALIETKSSPRASGFDGDDSARESDTMRAKRVVRKAMVIEGESNIGDASETDDAGEWCSANWHASLTRVLVDGPVE